jgi:hypothetical protein
MKFSLKKLFSRKSKKQKAEAQPAAAETSAAAPAPEPVPAPEPEQPKAPAPDPLARFKEPEGYYLLNLNVSVQNKSPDGKYLHMISNRDTDFLLAIVGNQYLPSVKMIATEVENFLYKDIGFDVGHTYFKRKDANFFFDGYDQILGLPPGDGFQLVLVPEGSDWKPQFAPPPMRAIPGTSTVFQHPATLLPQFQPAVIYPIMFVNGFDISQPVSPQIPGAQPKPAEKAAETAAETATQQFNGVTMPPVTPPMQKPEAAKEEKPASDAAATPAAAPPPPPPKM